MSRVALVAQFDSLDTHGDGPPLVAALLGRGIDAEVVAWGGDRDWATFDGVIVRNAYDYLDRLEEFLAWAARVEGLTRLANPAAVLAWNSDKRYLRVLSESGVPIVPTVWIDPGGRLPRWRWEEVVVKPSVSAGARNTARYAGDDRAAIEAHVAAIGAAGSTALVQPYLSEVDRDGEWGTYVFDGRVSHVIAKAAVLRAGAPPPDDFALAINQPVVAAEVTGELVGFASSVMAALPARLPAPLYARVDAVRGGDGRLALLELECIEPFFFLETQPDAGLRFARAVESWLGRPRVAQEGLPNSR